MPHTVDMQTTEHLNRISRGLHAANIAGHVVLVGGSRGAWVVSVDGETISTDCASLVDAEYAAEITITAKGI
jgi:predicted regulator of Ras-like GTPase activity (Roadblock/LC7/MglB family)